MQIKEIPYHQIDFQKYDDCISHSQYPIVYAESWYLDIVTKKNWSVLVYGDYDAVMPIPYARLKRNLFIKTVCQPMFCQQLGFFVKNINSEVESLFLKKLNEFNLTTYHLNASHNNNQFNLKKRTNYILDLNQEYDKIYRNYRKNRKYDLRSWDDKKNRIIDFDDVQEYIHFLKIHTDYLKIKNIQKLQQLLEILKIKNLLIGKKIVNLKGEIICLGFVVKSKNRLILLTYARNSKIQINGAATILINAFIQENANQNMIFDFEGSMIKGVAEFNQSFGAKNQPYLAFRKT